MNSVNAHAAIILEVFRHLFLDRIYILCRAWPLRAGADLIAFPCCQRKFAVAPGVVRTEPETEQLFSLRPEHDDRVPRRRFPTGVIVPGQCDNAPVDPALELPLARFVAAGDGR